jgi:PAS domain S-box-containing protein
VQDSDDIRRLAAIDRHGLLHAALGPRLHALTERAASIFDVPMAAISIVGVDACWFVGRHGFLLHTTPRLGTLGDAALREPDTFVCPDAAARTELLGDELVAGPTAVRFYASAPIETPDGVRLGGLVLMSPLPRALSPREVRNLAGLAATYGELLLAPGAGATASWRPPVDDSEALRKLAFVIEELPVILWTTDLRLRFTWAGGAGLTALHLTGPEVLDLSLTDFFSRDRRGILHVEAHRAALEGQSHTTEARFEDRTYRCRLDPLRGPSGADSGPIVGVIGLAVDITDRVHFETAVQESEARYRVIARATNDVVRDWDIERDEIAWNAALSTVFRYPGPPDVLGLAWWLERIHPDDRDRVVVAMRSALSGGASGWNDEYRFQRGDGTYASVFDRGFITRDGRGRAVRMLGSMLDVTERKVMEAKLIQAERLASMGTLATGVAHEINNPLTYIMANVGYVSERLSRPSPADKALPRSAEELAEELAEVRAALEEAQEGAVRIRQIVRDLKVFARGDDERYGLIDVRQNLESSISMVWNEIRHRARLVKELGPVPAVEGNESRLGQVFLNLLLNAAQAIREGDAASNQIRVATSTDEAGRVRVVIEDTGVGIAPDLLRRIFDPFFTTKPVGLGTGLGLFICHGIIRAMGGDIVAESEVGRGARFQITLPPARVISSPPEPPRQVGARPLPRRPRVLIVDDEARVAQGLERTLSREYDVVLAYGGRQAAELMVRDQDFDIVLCDLMMPELAGSALFALIESTWPHLAARVIFMTGGAFTAETTSFLERVPNPRLDKPFDTDRLHAIIRSME